MIINSMKRKIALTRNHNASEIPIDVLAPYDKFIKKLENQSLLTSFGQMVLSKNDTCPQYRFPKANRSITTSNVNTDYLYSPTSEKNYKFTKDPQWKFGTSARDAIFNKERFDSIDHPYHQQHDTAFITKKWTKPLGGAFGCERRLVNGFKEKTPGPGRYHPSYESVKERGPQYGIGLRLSFNSIMPLTGTNPDIAPGTYETAEKSDYHKFAHTPKVKFGSDNRKPLNPKKNTVNETYLLYSSMGSQANSPKKSEPSSSFGKADRFIQPIEKN